MPVIRAFLDGDRLVGSPEWFLDSSELVERLRLLSDLCQRLSDRSHETFQTIDEVLLSGIEQSVDALDLSLKTIFSK